MAYLSLNGEPPISHPSLWHCVWKEKMKQRIKILIVLKVDLEKLASGGDGLRRKEGEGSLGGSVG